MSRCREVKPHIPALLLIACCAVGLPACGGDDPQPTTSVGRVSGPASNGEELEADTDRSAQGVDGLSVCALLPAARVQRLAGVSGLREERNDSLDLSICRYSRGRVNIRVMLDGAADATRRYYNQLSEAAQKFNTIPSLRPHNVKGVGDDRTYGGTGAWWTNGREQLVAFSDDRIARVTVHVPGTTNAQRRAAAVRVTRALFAKLPEERS